MRSASMKIHPLVAAAAASVIMLSAVGTAAIMGWLPGSHSEDQAPLAMQPAATAPTPAAAPAAVPAMAEAPPAPAKPVERHAAARPKPTPARTTPQPTAAPAPATAQAPAAPPVAAAAPACIDCGKVLEVRTVEIAAKPSGVGVVAGAVVGGLLGNQVGGGNGKKLATVAGAIGGGFAGNEIEKRSRKTLHYEVDVRMQDGQTRVFTYEAEPAWRAGDPVKVVNGELAAR